MSRASRWLPVLLVLALLAGAVASYRYDLGARWFGTGPDPTTEPAEVPPPPGVSIPPLPRPPAVAEEATSGELLPQRVRRVVAPRLRDPDLGRSVHALVVPLTGDAAPVFTAGSGTFLPASTTKLLTTTAALDVLGPDHRFTTRVVARGRTVTLVGGGDPLLARRPDREGWPAGADVATLARRAAHALGRGRPVRVRYDAGLFDGPADNPYWRPDYVPDDIVSPITALWVDEGREADGSGRADDPAADAAAAFAAALEARGVRVAGRPTPGPSSGRGEVVAEMSGAPLSQVVEHTLLVSDNEATEVLAHHVGLAVLHDASFEGGARAVRRTLTGLGVPLPGTVLRDGSGLSRRNRLDPRTLAAVLRVAASDEHPDLRPVLTGLPVGGFTGSLTFRFDEAPEQGLGHVRAKTGTLTGVSALAGVGTDRDGTPFVFVLAADGVRLRDTLDARQDLDSLAGALGACRCSR